MSVTSSLPESDSCASAHPGTSVSVTTVATPPSQATEAAQPIPFAAASGHHSTADSVTDKYKSIHISRLFGLKPPSTPPHSVYGFVIPSSCVQRYAPRWVSTTCLAKEGTPKFEAAVEDVIENFDDPIIQSLIDFVRVDIPGLPISYPYILHDSSYDGVFPLADERSHSEAAENGADVEIPERELELLRETLGLSKDEKPRWFHNLDDY